MVAASEGCALAVVSDIDIAGNVQLLRIRGCESEPLRPLSLSHHFLLSHSTRINPKEYAAEEGSSEYFPPPALIAGDKQTVD
jgi:hypothetical protein